MKLIPAGVRFQEKTWNILIIFFYLLTHVFFLTKLPVFADEAIYIHWAQVAFNEPSKYLFLSMLDGKPPLHIWLLMPFVKFFPDPLFGARLFSVLIGFATLFSMRALARSLGAGKQAQTLSMLMITITPFWFLFHRMALAEPLITLFFTIALCSCFQFFQLKHSRYLTISVLSIGAALWTKTNTIFLLPVLFLFPFGFSLLKKNDVAKQVSFHKKEYILYIFSIIGGMFLFFLLKFSPLFTSLFSRSADYTFSVSQLILGEWKYVFFQSFPRIGFWFLWYCTPFFFSLMFFRKRTSLLFSAMTLLYIIPIILFGKILYSRYFYPALVPLTLMAVFGYETALRKYKKLTKKILLMYGAISIVFILTALGWPNKTAYTIEDRNEYITAWSSGYGITQVRDFLINQIHTNTTTLPIIVATEGFFGTLPDGLSIYFDKARYTGKIVIHGVGQPIEDIKEELIQLAADHEVYLIVNKHRFFETDVSKFSIIQEYPRPYGAPSLLLIRIKNSS